MSNLLKKNRKEKGEMSENVFKLKLVVQFINDR